MSKKFGSISELVSTIFRTAANRAITFRPDDADYSGNREFELPPDAGANDALVGAAATQTLTNKTLTSPTLGAALISNYEDLTHVATPANPSAGRLRVYAKSDNKLYGKTSAGVEAEIGAAAVTATNDGLTTGVVTTFRALVQDGHHAVTAANFTIGAADGRDHIYISTGGSDRTVTLPDATVTKNRVIRITKSDSAAGRILLAFTSSQTLDGVSTGGTFQLFKQFDTLTVRSDGANWTQEGSARAYEIRSFLLDNQFTGGTLYLVRVGDLVIMRAAGVTHASATSRSSSTGLIPANFRPPSNVRFPIYAEGADGRNFMTINSNGTFTTQSSINQTGYDAFAACWLVNNV